MRKCFQKARETFNLIDETLESRFIASAEQRANGLKRSVEEEGFKHFLLSAGAVGDWYTMD